MHRDPSKFDRELEMIANRKRREILDYFVTTDNETTTIEELSRQLAEARTDGGGGDGDQPLSTKGLHRDLHHIHLRKLADCGLVQYDSRTGTVRYQSDELVEELMQLVSE